MNQISSSWSVDLHSFTSEAEMQEWLITELQSCDGLADLITNTEYLEKFESNKIEAQQILKSFNNCLSAIYINELISDDKNISLKKPDSLKPDLVMYAAESQGMVIVELKNISGPTRQAGTELSAYAAELRSYIPFLSDGDLFNVIISPIWPTLLRHYVFHEIFWQQRNILCLQPVETEDGIRLEILPIENVLETEESTKISGQHIAGYQLCLYDHDLYSKNPDRTRLDKHFEQMKAALSVMTTEGNRQKGHGFAFLWKDHWELSLAPYSISIFNMAPFQSIERFLHEVESLEDLSVMQKKFITLIQEQDPTGHGESLHKITSSGSEFLSGFCSPQMEGFHNWDVLSEIMLNRAELLAFQGWGLFGDLFNERLIKEYSEGNIDISVTSAELGLEVVNELIDPDYQFIHMHHLDLDE
jgi:hypothetical protein